VYIYINNSNLRYEKKYTNQITYISTWLIYYLFIKDIEINK
jgi:hypothetical protein